MWAPAVYKVSPGNPENAEARAPAGLKACKAFLGNLLRARKVQAENAEVPGPRAPKACKVFLANLLQDRRGVPEQPGNAEAQARPGKVLWAPAGYRAQADSRVRPEVRALYRKCPDRKGLRVCADYKATPAQAEFRGLLELPGLPAQVSWGQRVAAERRAQAVFPEASEPRGLPAQAS